MKRLILMLSTAVCLLSSCQNYLDLKPKNQTVVGTLEDVKLMMGGNTRKNIMNLRIGKVVFSVKPSGIISTCISAI